MPPRPQAQVASLESELSAARLELRSLEDALAQVKVSGAARAVLPAALHGSKEGGSTRSGGHLHWCKAKGLIDERKLLLLLLLPQRA